MYCSRLWFSLWKIYSISTVWISIMIFVVFINERYFTEVDVCSVRINFFLQSGQLSRCVIHFCVFHHLIFFSFFVHFCDSYLYVFYIRSMPFFCIIFYFIFLRYTYLLYWVKNNFFCTKSFIQFNQTCNIKQ